MKPILEKYIEAWHESDRFSGAILVSKNNEIIFEKAYGYANEQFKISNRVNTKYNIGSFSKQFTAVSILKLYE